MKRKNINSRGFQILINKERSPLMKSMLHEATSVVKAIEKAWINSGKPLEFKVNVLEEGEKNFLGMCKRPAIVSITYDPRGKMCQSGKKTEAETKSFPLGVKDRQKGTAGKRPDERNSQFKREDVQADRGKLGEAVKDRFPKMQQPLQQPRKAGTETMALTRDGSRAIEDDGRWTDALMGDVREWIEGLMDAMRISTPFSLRSEDGKALKVAFEGPLGVEDEDARIFFTALSYLVIQFLKKKHKKRFPGFHLVISSQEHATGNKTTN